MYFFISPDSCFLFTHTHIFNSFLQIYCHCNGSKSISLNVYKSTFFCMYELFYWKVKVKNSEWCFESEFRNEILDSFAKEYEWTETVERMHEAKVKESFGKNFWGAVFESSKYWTRLMWPRYSSGLINYWLILTLYYLLSVPVLFAFHRCLWAHRSLFRPHVRETKSRCRRPIFQH